MGFFRDLFKDEYEEQVKEDQRREAEIAKHTCHRCGAYSQSWKTICRYFNRNEFYKITYFGAKVDGHSYNCLTYEVCPICGAIISEKKVHRSYWDDGINDNYQDPSGYHLNYDAPTHDDEPYVAPAWNGGSQQINRPYQNPEQQQTSANAGLSQKDMKFIHDNFGSSCRAFAITSNAIASVSTNGHYVYSGIPTTMADRIKDYASRCVVINDILIKANGSYLIFYDGKQATWSGIPQPMADAILQANKNGEEFISGDYHLQTNRWMLITNRFWRGTDNKYLNEHHPGKFISSICYDENSGQIYSVDGDGILMSDRNLSDKMKNDLAAKKWKTTRVKVFGDKFMILGENDGEFSGFF